MIYYIVLRRLYGLILRHQWYKLHKFANAIRGWNILIKHFLYRHNQHTM